MKFGHLILRKMFKFVATRYKILTLNTVKGFQLRWAFAYSDSLPLNVSIIFLPFSFLCK